MDLYYHNRALASGTAGAALAAPLLQTCYLIFIACVLIKLIYPLPNRYAVTTVVALLSIMPYLS